MKVDFYVLEEISKQRGLYFVCKLVEKHYLNQEHVFIHPASKEEAAVLDDLLWTYRDDSFLPHHLDHPPAACLTPIHIGEGHVPQAFQGVFFNLHPALPSTFMTGHVVEIVFSEPTMQQLARERYKQYREQGRNITTYKIKTSDL